jgi:hypothetical protein
MFAGYAKSCVICWLCKILCIFAGLYKISVYIALNVLMEENMLNQNLPKSYWTDNKAMAWPKKKPENLPGPKCSVGLKEPQPKL